MADRRVKKPRGCSRSNIHRLIKLAHEECHWHSSIHEVAVTSNSNLSVDEVLSDGNENDGGIITNTVEVVHEDSLTSSMMPSTSRSCIATATEPAPQEDNKSDEDMNEDHLLTTVSTFNKTATMIALEVAFEANLSLRATSIMLRKFKQLLPELPMDARTLLGTPRVCGKSVITGGEYVHFGVKECIEQAVRGRCNEHLKCVHMQLHIDGVTLFKSSRQQLWPILARLTVPRTPVFVIGMFCGEAKPGNVHEYLAHVVANLKEVLRTGITLSNYNVHVDVILECIIGDAPARAFFRQVKNHTGYYACEKCTACGVYADRRMVYPNLEYSLRNDRDFRSRRQSEHHVGNSPFECLNIDMIACFPLDYMHMVCLGLTKRLIGLWRSGPLLLEGASAPEGSKMYKVKVHRTTDNFAMACQYEGFLEKLSDIPSTDCTVPMDRQGKRKIIPAARSDFTDEADSIPAKMVYSVDIAYSPPPPTLDDMSTKSPSKRRSPLSSLENIQQIITPIATSSFMKSPPYQSSSPAVHQRESSELSKIYIQNKSDQMEAVMSSMNDHFSKMTKTIDNLITQNVRIREEMHAMRLELNALRYQHVVDSSSSSPMLPVRFPMQTVEDIQLLNMKLEDGETYLLLVNYLSKLGGKSVSDCISNLMKSTMTDYLASNINWRGVNSRFSLASTVFASAIVETVMKHQYVGVSHAVVKEKMQRWVQNARRKVTKEGEKTDHETDD